MAPVQGENLPTTHEDVKTTVLSQESTPGIQDSKGSVKISTM